MEKAGSGAAVFRNGQSGGGAYPPPLPAFRRYGPAAALPHGSKPPDWPARPDADTFRQAYFPEIPLFAAKIRQKLTEI